MTDTTPQSVDSILAMLRAGKDPDTGEPHTTEAEARQNLYHLIASKMPEQEAMKITPERPDGFYPPKKHTWVTNADGTVDSFAYESGDYHNGPLCAVCGFGGCEHCNEGVQCDETCAYQEAINEWLDGSGAALEFNKVASIRNEALGQVDTILKQLFGVEE